MVRDVGEHPQYELKRGCDFDQLADKIEFVKDVQSICTSRIETEKYLVVGADESSRCFVQISNLADFDEARIRARLGKYLVPLPQFEVFNLESADKKTFVLFVFPRQRTRRILVKETVEDSSGKTTKILIRKGDLWTKGQSTGKRLADPEDWDEIYEERIEFETERRTRQRTAHFLERAMAHEKLREGYGLSSVPTFSTDAEFRALIESLCIAKDRPRFLVLLEGLRDDLIEAWYASEAFGPTIEITQIRASLSERIAKVRDHKTNVFLPAMQKLTSAALYVVKNSGPLEFLTMAVQLLEEVYETTNLLRISDLAWLSPRGLMPTSSSEHVSHTVPAFESLVSLHITGAYISKRKKFEYFPNLWPQVSRAADGDVVPPFKQPMAFWPLNSGFGEPVNPRDGSARIEFCVQRIKADPVFLRLFGSEIAAIEALCQYEFLLEITSYMAVERSRSPASAEYVKKAYPDIDFRFNPGFIAHPLANISGIAAQFFAEMKRNNLHSVEPLLFDKILAAYLRENDQKIFLEFLGVIEEAKAEFELRLDRIPPTTPWPSELRYALRRVGVEV